MPRMLAGKAFLVEDFQNASRENICGSRCSERWQGMHLETSTERRLQSFSCSFIFWALCPDSVLLAAAVLESGFLAASGLDFMPLVAVGLGAVGGPHYIYNVQ